MEEENISITNFLKQRYPMLLVDKVVDYNDKSTKTIKYFTNSDPFMLGHFKDFSYVSCCLIS
ncbi:3-hydroxyacyl-[acyl-carrier-protein] dehydratase FabZ [Lactobacillus helveticus]|nr:3-hydroxyacyl-[acyl-carrier-protein] dehydratase FabZ [Lactobacillus helveticus]NRO10561.1 3-hydroxyacyl-[acyl-carrier-protein] dehydratase FabZ [Lactobacillus helveticus]NRO66605.1 3-hydroxyacyl-[acyl-carrier-protein] dehydratase FabZ [Lactobacillus helveticus]